MPKQARVAGAEGPSAEAPVEAGSRSRLAELHTTEAVLQARIEERQVHATALQALQAEAGDLLRRVRQGLEADIEQRRQQLAAASAEVGGVERRLQDLRAEAATLESGVSDLRATLEVLSRERESADRRLRGLGEDLAAAERQAVLARDGAAELERRRGGLQGSLQEASDLLQAIRGEVEALRAEKQALESAFRPLRPYHPPLGRIRLATIDVQVNSKLQQHDATALRLYAEQTGMEIRRVITEALRNYLSPEAYAAALLALEEQARQGLEPQVEAAVERVPPEGAGAQQGRFSGRG